MSRFFCGFMLSDGLLSPAFLDSACVKSAEDALDVCERLEFPVMIKASAGGGGKGIRKIHNRNEVIGAYRQVVNEVKDSTVLIMKFVERCRFVIIRFLFCNYSGIFFYIRNCIFSFFMSNDFCLFQIMFICLSDLDI